MRRKEKLEKKRRDAEQRTKARRKRMDEQQLAKLDAGGWDAKKERTRLHTYFSVPKFLKD